jgi:prepilin-type N-terminal cleavage/methylation domain-containing protein
MMTPAATRSEHMKQHGRNSRGFTLLELMLVVVIIGILAAISIPNFLRMKQRALEGSVKANMHTVQIALEDFGLQNDFKYPIGASDALPDGRTLAQICPTGSFPVNPYTKLPSVVIFNSFPTVGNKGELAINPATANSYQLRANGSTGDTLALILTSGQ